MDTEQRALLNAVITDPDDDGPRGVYADWLEEQGYEESAHKIRFMLANPTWSDHQEFKNQSHPTGYRIVRRGFVDEIGITVADFMGNCHTIAKEYPVRIWRLLDFTPEMFPLTWNQGQNTHTYYFIREYPSKMKRRSARRGQYLPRELFAHLTAEIDISSVTKKPMDFRGYQTFKEAHEAVQRACYCHARSKLDFLPRGLVHG